jgi:hypothetical protein
VDEAIVFDRVFASGMTSEFEVPSDYVLVVADVEWLAETTDPP